MHKKILIILGILVITVLLAASLVYKFFFQGGIMLKKTDGNINVLLLGVGGGSHDGPDLTDTIIFANINSDKNKISLVSIPRDLWIPTLKQKINAAYAIGESKGKGQGIVLTKNLVSSVVNKPINYAISIDFDGFVKAVDYIGGLDIDVENSFDDYQYPVEKEKENLCGNTIEEVTAKIATMEATIVFPCRYEHASFSKGLEHMSGKRALIFVRSRYAEGIEGTDFARSLRQQKVIKAFKDKIFSLKTFSNPVTLINLYKVLSKSIQTDIKMSEFDDFIRLGQKMQKASIQSSVIDYGNPDENKHGLLINPSMANYKGTWVLIPRKGESNYSEIGQYVQCIITSGLCTVK